MSSDVQNKVSSFFSHGRNLVFKKGKTLLEAEEEPDGVFYIKKGSVKMTAISAGGEEVVINTFKPGAFFPVGWVLNDTPNPYFYQSVEDTEVQKVTKHEMLNFLKQEPSVVFDLIKRIYKGLDGYFMRMEYLMAGNASSRLLAELIILAKRFGQKNSSGSGVTLKITEKDLASQTGIARETVSREFKKLTEKKLLKYEKETLVINDLTMLEKSLYQV